MSSSGCIVAMGIGFVVTIFIWLLVGGGTEVILIGEVAVILALLVGQFYALAG